MLPQVFVSEKNLFGDPLARSGLHPCIHVLFSFGGNVLQESRSETSTRQEGLSGADSKKEVALWALQKRCCMVRDERSNRTEGCSGNMVRLDGNVSLQFDGAVTPTVLASAIAFVGLPLVVFLGGMMRHRQSALPLFTDLKVPALIVI
ncbi:uncharacterized protein LOC144109016 isoform X2 [Amblyomma americanum]